jgi:hypothetical protein
VTVPAAGGWDAEPGEPLPGPPGYVAGECEHPVSTMEWDAGYRTCERCPQPGDAAIDAALGLRRKKGKP